MQNSQTHLTVRDRDGGQENSATVLIQAPITANSYGLALPKRVLVLSIMYPAKRSVTASKILLAIIKDPMMPTGIPSSVLAYRLMPTGIPSSVLAYRLRYPRIMTMQPSEMSLVFHAKNLPSGNFSLTVLSDFICPPSYPPSTNALQYPAARFSAQSPCKRNRNMES